MEVKTVGIACDHAGFPLKQFVLEYLEKKGYPVKDYGTYSDASVDYPDFGHALAKGIESGEVYPGIGICGSGEGIAMTLNKHQGVRARIGMVQGDCSFGSSAQRCQRIGTSRSFRRQQDRRGYSRRVLCHNIEGSPYTSVASRRFLFSSKVLNG